jgi:hypothetical protein
MDEFCCRNSPWVIHVMLFQSLAILGDSATCFRRGLCTSGSFRAGKPWMNFAAGTHRGLFTSGSFRAVQSCEIPPLVFAGGYLHQALSEPGNPVRFCCFFHRGLSTSGSFRALQSCEILQLVFTRGYSRQALSEPCNPVRFCNLFSPGVIHVRLFQSRDAITYSRKAAEYE